MGMQVCGLTRRHASARVIHVSDCRCAKTPVCEICGKLIMRKTHVSPITVFVFFVLWAYSRSISNCEEFGQSWYSSNLVT